MVEKLRSKVVENCSSPIIKHPSPTEWTKVPLCDLSHTKYFQRDLTHTTWDNSRCGILLFLYKTHQSKLQGPFYFPLHLQKPKKCDFLGQNLHCKLSVSKFLQF